MELLIKYLKFKDINLWVKNIGRVKYKIIMDVIRLIYCLWIV